MARIVFAPDSFKGTASARVVASSLAAGWRSVRPADSLVLLPMADGGEGTLDAFELAYPDAERMPLTVSGPHNRPVSAHWLRLPDNTAVVELASTSGLTLLDAELAPMTAHTEGFGQAIADALGHGATRVLLALGGSASTDGGVGALTQLGAVVLDAAGERVKPGGGGLAEAASVDLSGLRSLPVGGAVVLGDVTNPLLGAHGAAAVFGPQKGASAAEVVLLDAALARFAALTGGDTQASGAGAAGGAGYGLALWGATLSAGAAGVGEALGVASAIAASDLVITGEGRFDAQSMAGKVPSYVFDVAGEVPVALVAGAIEAPTDAFAQAISLTEISGSTDAATGDPSHWLELAGAVLARGFAG